MIAPMARLTTAATPAAEADRRRAPRFTAWHEARLQTAQGSEEVLLTDVSTHGCCLRGDSPRLRVGAILSVAVGENPALPAVVRWVRDGSAGMEFLRPIPRDRHEWHYLMDISQ